MPILPKWEPINLSAKVFGHISQGLYRTPAGAIKELISNSFDADASITKIHTSFPRFETFSCEDDGGGISPEEFTRLMQRGVGTSYKRVIEEARTPVYKRPVVGRLGIGILAMAQICSEFDLISHHKESKEAFKVTIRFPPYTKREIDKILKKHRRREDPEDLIHGGEYLLERVGYDQDKVGVRIFTRFLRENFRKRMRHLASYARQMQYGKEGPYVSFEEFMNAAYGPTSRTKSINRLSDYDQLLFGLALTAPIPYFQGGKGNITLQIPQVREYQKALEGYGYTVEVDNLTLAKPLYLPSDRGGRGAKDCKVGRPKTRQFDLSDGPHKERVDVKQYPIALAGLGERFSCYELSYSRANVGGQPLEFSGYLFQQTGRLYPREIQGALIRIRNVAIGGYDPDIMTYPYAEGPRYSMVSLEVFVEKGFEDALNIDRESFNYLDSHYIRSQAFIHSLLHGLVFPETWSEEKRRNRRQRQLAAAQRDLNFVRGFTVATRESYSKLHTIDEPVKGRPKDFSQSPVYWRPRAKVIEIHTNHPVIRTILRRRKYRPFSQQIIVAFERANMEKTEESRREMFYKLLRVILTEM